MIELFQFLNQGGLIMWLIGACSVVGGFIFCERLLLVHRSHIATGDFLKGIFNILHRENVVEAISICEETAGPVPHIVRAAILHYDDDRNTIRQAIEEAGLAEIPRLERNMNMLLTIAQITPLLGLLGTVVGLMQTLQTIQQKAPLVHSGDLSGGLWVALLTTAAGLTVAIPAYASYNFLVGRVQSLVLDMERVSGEILNFLIQRQSQPREELDETARNSV